MTSLFSWELLMLLLATHSLATVIKAITPTQYRENLRFKRIVLPGMLWTFTTFLCIYVVAPTVLITVYQKALFGFVISALQTQAFAAATAIHPAFKHFDVKVEETVKQSLKPKKNDQA